MHIPFLIIRTFENDQNEWVLKCQAKITKSVEHVVNKLCVKGKTLARLLIEFSLIYASTHK